ncbi:MAG: bifunctional diguanylate cyclase/phosphodiesterase [Alphaproteobacteria bacterium]|nr:bifunctional diguanylate cyclase/phosphodiesterase [Alphaproteobacteria bacterium]
MSPPSDLADLLSAAGDAAYDWDLRNDTIDWHGAWGRIFASPSPPQDSQALYHTLFADDRHIVFGGEAVTIDRQFRVSGKAGSVLWVHERGACELDDKRHSIRQRGVWRIIDQPAHGIEHAESQHRDGLTGCFKRRALQSQLARAIESAKLARRVGAYLVVDIDKMSFVNEAVGTDGGDAVLRGVAARLAQIIPSRAVLGRVGGDIFGILLPEPLGNELQILAERIISDFHNAPLIAANAPLHITVSVGGVRVPTVAKNANESMIFAEQALHMARQRGRNAFVEYIDSPERAQENRQLLELAERIKRAFKNNGFRLAYQPIVDAKTGKPVCYEALVRMFGDDNKPIAAALFVPMIEQMGLAGELDKLVLDMAVRDMEAVPDLNLAVNVSGFTASQADWPDHMRRVLEQHPDVAKRLIVEITETVVIVDVAETRRLVDTLRSLGARASLDDFGAGSTSIRYLRELGLSIMKIDKELLNDLLINREQQHLVSVLIDLARGLGIQTVAEGVETQEVATWLQGARVDYLQGYFFGKPSLERPQKAAGLTSLFPSLAVPVSLSAAP